MEFIKEKLFDYSYPRDVVESLIKYSGKKPTVVEIPVKDSVGKILANDLIALKDKPEHDLSHVDGFAVRAIDTFNAKKENPVKLRIVREVDPRNANEYELKKGETVYVDTGFPIPVNSDAIIPIENVKIVDGKEILVFNPIKEGENVIPRGIDFRKGDVLIRKQTLLTGIHLRILFDAGYSRIQVYRPPKISIFPIGDELVSINDYQNQPGKIPETSTYMVKYLLETLPVEVKIHDILPDKPEIIVSRIKKELEKPDIDIIITISGVSLGRKDHSWVSLKKELKPKYVFRGVKMVQGRANSGMVVGEKILFNLPGFVQATFAGTVILVLPVISYLNGLGTKIKLPCKEFQLSETTDFGEKRLDFYRIRFVKKNGNEARIITKMESSMASLFTKTEGFVIIPPGIRKLEKGTTIRVFIPDYKNTEYGKCTLDI